MINNTDPQSAANADPEVVKGFGEEWRVFNHKNINQIDLLSAFNQYFNIFPFDKVNQESIGFDMGCGSGRWAKFIAPKIGKLTCVDPSSVALEQAKNNLADFLNCEFECASVSASEIPNESQDFGYCLGVLHHIPDTKAGLASCADKLKVGAPFLLYLYYRFDNKPQWFQLIWMLSDFVRKMVCIMPFPIKLFVSQLIAVFIYLPLSKMSWLLEKLKVDVSNIPLSDYRNKPLYVLRTDALDRFGTRLEQRFTKDEIFQMMTEVGFVNIKFSEETPYWVALGFKR